MLGPEVSIRFAVELLQLAEFFFQCHAGQQCINPSLEVLGLL
jgi:hypothetical protein